jgi:hypothetical protein
MKVNVSRLVYEASGRDEGSLDATLNWVLGYFSKQNPHTHLLTHLTEVDGSAIAVEISDENVKKINVKFGSFSDALVSTLLIVAYSLGGME